MFDLISFIQKEKNMINPSEVVYSGIENLRILKNTEQYAIAIFNYNGKLSYGLRWHGGDGDIGTPSAHGKPTWFILPNDIIVNNIKINVKGDK